MSLLLLLPWPAPARLLVAVAATATPRNGLGGALRCGGWPMPMRLSRRPEQPPPPVPLMRAPQWTRGFTGAAARRGAADDERLLGRRGERKPWHRIKSDRSRADPSRGQVLTTPTRLLKIILPLPLYPEQRLLNDAKAATGSDKKTGTATYGRPLALLVHPQQPLSYVASLIQAELPPLKTSDGGTKLPAVWFRAAAEEGEDADPSAATADSWPRWSGSAEVGDFVRDAAARGGAFVVDIEGLSAQDLDGDGRRDVGGVRVAVPSFEQRTVYMRRRLRAVSHRIEEMARLKQECDLLAQQGAHRIAKAGLGVTAVWWVIVYYASFHTTLTWDTMEPITYLAGLLIAMAGYWYFLHVSRDLSYREAMRATVSRRQQALYRERGFDPDVWEALVHETNALRKDIRLVADEYAVEWDEARDLGGEKVREVLEEEEEEEREKDEEDGEEQEKSEKKTQEGDEEDGGGDKHEEKKEGEGGKSQGDGKG